MKKIKLILLTISTVFILLLSACNISTGNSYLLLIKSNDDLVYERNVSSINSISKETLNKYVITSDYYKSLENEFEIVGYYEDEALLNQITYPLKINKDTTIFVIFNDNTITNYIVTLIKDNGEENIEIISNDGSINLPTPVKDGYEFIGWYSGDIKYTNSSIITANTTLTARWNKLVSTYKVEVYVNLEKINEISINQNQALETQFPANPTLDGYKFIKWVDASGNEITSKTIITNDTKIYAEYIKLYTVKFVDQYNNLEDVTVLENNKITLPTVSHEGYTFDGWYINADYQDKFDQNEAINSNLILYAKWTKIPSTTEINIIESGAYSEGAYINFSGVSTYTNTTDYQVTYKKENNSTVYTVDSELIRKYDNYFRCDILGLSSGTYNFTISVKNSSISTSKSLEILSYDRSGYAHFNNSNGVGAYNNDGTLKNGTIVIYVSDKTKNDNFVINGKSYSGLVKLLNAGLNTPLCIRILGTINAATWNELDYRDPGVVYGSNNPLPIEKIVDQNGNALPRQAIVGTSEIKKYNSMSNDIANGITELKNLSNKIAYSNGEYDSYFNMCDVVEQSNITVEGVGIDASLYQWGFTWSKCNSIEVRNLTFKDNTEDACSFQGGSNTNMNYGNYWVHNCVFNRGKNNWDLCPEQDKHYGDGSIDLKYCKNTTVSYNVFNNCKKTGLVGGGDSALTQSVSFHHNYYNQVGSRLPLGRQANMHIYNNYYYKCSTAQDIRANAFVLSEANYFEGCTVPQKVTKTSTYTKTVIKSYNDYLIGCGSSQASVVRTRTESLDGNCKPDGSTDYSNFDTNSSLFYYDSTNKSTKADNLFTANDAKKYATVLSGLLGGYVIKKYDNTEKPADSNPTQSTFTTMNLVFPTAGDYTSNVSCGNGFSIIATSDKNVTVSKTCISLNGGGSTKYRSILADVNTTETLTVNIRITGGKGDRTLRIMDANNNTITDILVTNGDITTTVTISGSKQYYFYSTGSGLNIYNLTISKQ